MIFCFNQKFEAMSGMVYITLYFNCDKSQFESFSKV
jgi:hypothetical protein